MAGERWLIEWRRKGQPNYYFVRMDRGEMFWSVRREEAKEFRSKAGADRLRPDDVEFYVVVS